MARVGRPGEPAGYNPPAIARTGDGCLQVVVITTIEATVWHRRQTTPNDGWSSWQSLGVPGGHKAKASPGVPALGVNAAGRLEVFVVVEDQVLHAAQQPGPAWSAWSSMGQPGGDVPDSPVVVANADGRLELFTLGISVGPTEDTNAHAIWHRRQDIPGGDWRCSYDQAPPHAHSLSAMGYQGDPRLLVELAGRRRALQLEIAQQSDAQMKR